MSPANPTIEIIIPVKNMAAHLRACLSTLMPQLGADDLLTVVDDGSTDDTAAVARAAGARVLTPTVGSGPYAARHSAAIASTADILLFVDGRCRARPGLIESHRAMLSTPGAVLSCTDVQTESGPTLAAKIASTLNPFSIDGYIGVPGRADYYPTANLGITRATYLAVGGFRRMRSAGDADLCWRVLKQTQGSFATDRRVLMSWVPRDKMTDLFEQWYRYGQSSVALNALHPPAEVGRSTGAATTGRMSALLDGVRREPRKLLVLLLRTALHVVYLAGRLRVKLSREAFTDPGLYGEPRPVA
ncbi:glycosyl transferase family 2 [Jatrophihabitans sp. GAS493]|uniref:glycosyltransferase n=1 Tax=Jatrophihabitans sp. GAS493 TaxID=1907575 RepID=UPI000BB7924B|nr:glycosyltransferase [Jatrophihabitans sp. GAS493]SOD71584.1 glycosyl transferase family 2 [Jatrophihabitans sp. GAS493]